MAKRKPSETTVAARSAFRVPLPKGPKPGPIPKSTRYVPPTDEDEEAAFASVTGRSGQRGRASAEALSAARLRAGNMVTDEDEETDEPVRGFLEDQPEEFSEEEQAYQDSPERLPVGPAIARRTKALGQPLPLPHAATLTVAGFTPFAPKAQAPLPRDPRVVQSSTLAELSVTPTNARDIDRLWDWIRADADGGQQFLGQHCSHSQQLHGLVQQLVALEASSIAIFRSLLWGPRHFGFLMLSPILAREQTALCHIYLEADARGGFEGLVGPLVAIAEQLVPNKHLAFYAPGVEWERVYASVLGQLGFKKHAMFIR